MERLVLEAEKIASDEFFRQERLACEVARDIVYDLNPRTIFWKEVYSAAKPHIQQNEGIAELACAIISQLFADNFYIGARDSDRDYSIETIEFKKKQITALFVNLDILNKLETRPDSARVEFLLQAASACELDLNWTLFRVGGFLRTLPQDAPITLEQKRIIK